MQVGSHGLQPGDHHAGDGDHGHDQNGDGDHLQRQYALHWPMPKKDQSLNLKLGTLEGDLQKVCRVYSEYHTQYLIHH